MNKSKKQPIRFTLILTSAILCLLAAPFAKSAEPEYNGKTLSELLLDLKGQSHEEIANQDKEAIRQIGTNGIPTLIDLLGVKNKNVKKVLSKIHDKNLTYYYKFDEDTLDSQESLRKLGVDGFAILGTNAEFAVPQIAKVFDEHDNETAFQAARALIMVGPKGFSVLTNAINDPDPGVRDVVIRVIGKEGGGDPQAIRQLLVNALKDYPLIRLHAADFLRGKEPDLVIPALIPLLDVSDYDRCRSDIDKASIYGQCYRAANTLMAYGPAAKSAAPKLLSVFTNVVSGTNEYLIRCLTGDLLNALRKIDRDAAAEAEDFILNGGPLGVVDHSWTVTPLPNGKELIAGGFFQAQIPTKTNYIFSRAQLFDPVTGKRTETGSMNVAREGHVAILLRNGKVLIAGGEDTKGDDLSSAELYDLTTGKWTETGSMNAPHAGGEAVLQHNGKVLIENWRELYDPATEKWTVVPKR